MGTAAELLREPDHSLQFAVTEEARLRPQYLRLESSETVQPLSLSLDDVVVKSAVLLELMLFGASLHEASGADTSRLSSMAPGEIRALVQKVKETSGLDISDVARDVAEHFDLGDAQADAPQLSSAAVLRLARTLLESCPIDQIEAIARQQQLEQYGHRARVAFDGLQAYVIRNDAREDERIRIVGVAYRSGAFTLEQVATVLGLHPVDAVQIMEARGFCRSPDVVRLDAEGREDRLERIRRERLGRAGRPPAVSQEATARDVIASERIENVDARRWIPREVK